MTVRRGYYARTTLILIGGLILLAIVHAYDLVAGLIRKA